jgi:Flp pilus assembly protein TadG
MQIRQRKKGQAIVEMALVLPIFLFLIIGIIDFGRALHVFSNLKYQCVRAARTASKRIHPTIARNAYTSTTHASLADTQAAFWNFRSPMMPEANYKNVVFSGVGTSNRTVAVSASFDLELFTPVMGALIGGENNSGAITINAQAEEAKE